MTSTEFQLRHHHLIGDREKLDALRDARRAGLLAFADFLTDLDDYPDPWRVFASFCPGVELATVEKWAPELLAITVRPGVQDQHWTEVVLDHLTGVPAVSAAEDRLREELAAEAESVTPAPALDKIRDRTKGSSK